MDTQHRQEGFEVSSDLLCGRYRCSSTAVNAEALFRATSFVLTSGGRNVHSGRICGTWGIIKLCCKRWTSIEVQSRRSAHTSRARVTTSTEVPVPSKYAVSLMYVKRTLSGCETRTMESAWSGSTSVNFTARTGSLMYGQSFTNICCSADRFPWWIFKLDRKSTAYHLWTNMLNGLTSQRYTCGKFCPWSFPATTQLIYCPSVANVGISFFKPTPLFAFSST